MLHFKLLFKKRQISSCKSFQNKQVFFKLLSSAVLYHCMFIPSYCQHEQSCYSHKFEQNNYNISTIKNIEVLLCIRRYTLYFLGN